MKFLGLVGSLREKSFNKALMHAAIAQVPEGVEIEVFDRLGDIPPYNQDVADKAFPEVVRELKKRIEEADAILIATPEYNYSVPGILKNAIDWASRPVMENSWNEKPLGIMSASGGMLGGGRAQYHLRQMCVFLNIHPLNKPEVLVPFAAEKMTDGKITDAHTLEKIQELLTALVVWTNRLKQ